MEPSDSVLRKLQHGFARLTRRPVHIYWRLSRGLTLGVRGLVIDPQGRVFLVKHSYIPGWHLPGGGVEPGETVLDALARELQEEGNIELLETPALHGIYFHPTVSDRDHVVLFVVRCFRQPAPPVRTGKSSRTASSRPMRSPRIPAGPHAHASRRFWRERRSCRAGEYRRREGGGTWTAAQLRFLGPNEGGHDVPSPRGVIHAVGRGLG